MQTQHVAKVVGTCLFVCGFLSASTTRASDEHRAFGVERLRISLDRQGLLGTEWGAVLPDLSWDTGLWLGYAENALVLYDSNTGRRLGPLLKSRLGGSIVGTVGLFGFLQVGAEVPLILYQDRPANITDATSAPLNKLRSVGFGDIRLVPKAQLLSTANQGIDVSLLASLGIPSGGEHDYFGNRGASFAPELALSRALGPVRLAANVGYLLRKDVQVVNLEVEDELSLRGGIGYRFAEQAGGGRPIELDVNIATATAAAHPWQDRRQAPLELLAQAAYDLPVGLYLFAGGGVGLNRGYGTPDWRVFAGVRWAMLDNDKDKDGIPDAVDQCPDQPEDFDGFADDDGCPDLDNDNDGIPDAVDQCPNEPEDFDGFADDDGCPDLDNDNDGVPDYADNCPDEAGPAANAGCPEPDRDHDGVIDREDNCPDEPGLVEFHGCAAPQLVSLKADKIEILDRVYFKTGLAIIETRSYPLLENLAQVIAAHPEVGTVQVDGHTDDRGSASFNTKLSQERANAVVAFLVSRGVATERLTAKGFGPSRPIDSNKTERGRANNRRVEFNLVGAQGRVDSSGNDAGSDTIGP